jgi:uncharacterized protein (DUF427 family)
LHLGKLFWEKQHMAMSETDNTAPGFAKHPGYRLELVPSEKRVRVTFGGETIIDSCAARLVLESGHVPVYYFPQSDFRSDLAEKTSHSSYCPFKGHASYWTLNAGGKTAENAVWSYETPYDEAAAMVGLVAFYWQPMDGWFEEDEEIFCHARDPHVRLDIVGSTRPVRVEVGGITLAESSRARFLFETGVVSRHYVPQEDVRMDLLQKSATRSQCPYKGEAEYYSLIDSNSGEIEKADIAWSYPAPLPEATPIASHICFHKRYVDGIYVDDVRQEKPAAR